MNHEPEHEQAPITGLRALRRDQTPPHDLWPGIAARLKPRRRGLPGWIGYAAAASVAAIVGMGVMQALVRDASPATALAVPMSAGSESRHGALMAWAPPENAALVKANMKIVKSAESQLRHALEQDPDSRLLQRQLLRMQDQRQALRQLMTANADAGV